MGYCVDTWTSLQNLFLRYDYESLLRFLNTALFRLVAWLQECAFPQQDAVFIEPEQYIEVADDELLVRDFVCLHSFSYLPSCRHTCQRTIVRVSRISLRRLIWYVLVGRQTGDIE